MPAVKTQQISSNLACSSLVVVVLEVTKNVGTASPPSIQNPCSVPQDTHTQGIKRNQHLPTLPSAPVSALALAPGMSLCQPYRVCSSSAQESAGSG